MPSTVKEIEEAIEEAISPDFKGRLLERGLARSMIWKEGLLPEGSPHFKNKLSYDLLSYGYSLLSLALRLREMKGNSNLYISAFEKAALSITNHIHNGKPDAENDFHRILAASSYHLAHYSAKAFSLIHHSYPDNNFSPIEEILSLLILRDFNKIESLVLQWKQEGTASDESLSHKLETDIDILNEHIKGSIPPEEFGFDTVELPIVDLAITDNYYSAIHQFLFALETGNENILEASIERIDTSLAVCSELSMLPQWWVLKITKNLLKDTWESSFHKIIPMTPDQTHSESWALQRWLFIASLYKRNKSEINLWPSQIEAAMRAINDTDDLVVSLPTSAGKTRVAELCILRCLAIGKRVLFITPLRALSAQTEASLRKTFLPLGKTVSSLYGSMGTSDFEQDVLKTHDIVVGTPEKLDFALRNDPSIIDDVGLVVLDEGHMIGLSDRELSYEVQIQRLLKRKDAKNRRIVCLSAILPSGTEFDDFVQWLRQDKEGSAIQSDWRPTDLRFGEIIWSDNVASAKIDFTIGEEKPFIPGYIHASIPALPNPRKRTIPFPKNGQELTLATAWRLIEDEHTVLIYCPLKASVNSFATAIMDLHRRGALSSVLTVPRERLELARVLGKEWLGLGHPIVECLDIGVAVHHGGLPTPFRKEMENLLREGILKVTVSSPTLAQGLNLAATAVIMHSIHRYKEVIDVSEFKNVIGRAGRAFIDTQGLVLRPIFDKHNQKRRQWRALVKNTKARSMESGLVLLVTSLLQRISTSRGNTEQTIEYILNNANIWNFPVISGEPTEDKQIAHSLWKKHIKSLDTSLLSMLGEEEVSIGTLSTVLDTVLHSSLWQRRLAHHEPKIQELYKVIFKQRSSYIWEQTTSNQRKGYFLAGVGLETGQLLDAIAPQANVLLVNANIYILNNDQTSAINEIIQLAGLLFAIDPFIPKTLPDSWQDIITTWLKGEVLAKYGVSNINEVLQFVEDALIYRLPWGIEAIKVRAQANEDIIEGSKTIDKYELGWLVPAIENGTLNRSTALLMQAGFNSRSAAIIAVQSTSANFTNSQELREWLSTEIVVSLTKQGDWPTVETTSLWKKFILEYKPTTNTVWKSMSVTSSVTWIDNYAPQSNTHVKLSNKNTGRTLVLSSTGEEVGELPVRYDLFSNGIYHIKIGSNTDSLDIDFWGEGEDPFAIMYGHML